MKRKKKKSKEKLIIKKAKKLNINETEFLKEQIRRKCAEPIEENYHIWLNEGEKKPSSGKTAKLLVVAFNSVKKLCEETQNIKKFDEYITKLLEFYLTVMENTDEKFHKKVGDLLLKERIGHKYKYSWIHKKLTFNRFWEQLGEILSGERKQPKKIIWK